MHNSSPFTLPLLTLSTSRRLFIYLFLLVLLCIKTRVMVESWDQRTSPNPCDLCEGSRHFILVLSTGRTGSTTLMQMINLLPDTSISGEHSGLLYSFKTFVHELHMHSLETKQHKSLSWQNNKELLHSPSYEGDSLCWAQDWFWKYSGMKKDAKIKGFKETRYTKNFILEFAQKIFPCAKIVINYREDTFKQSRSGFKANEPNNTLAVDELYNETMTLIGFQQKQPTKVYPFSLESYNDLKKWDEMAGFLGHNCTFKKVLHLNKQGYDQVTDRKKTEIKYKDYVTCTGTVKLNESDKVYYIANADLIVREDVQAMSKRKKKERSRAEGEGGRAGKGTGTGTVL